MLSPHATYTQPFAAVHTIRIPAQTHDLGTSWFTVEVLLRSGLTSTLDLVPYPFPWWHTIAPNGDVEVHLSTNWHYGVIILQPVPPHDRLTLHAPHTDHAAPSPALLTPPPTAEEPPG